jgi:hypothetical protein
MMRFALFTLVLIGLLTTAFAKTTDQNPAHVRASELGNTPLVVGPLKITVSNFRGSFLKIGDGYIEVRVENTSAEFASFFPQVFSLVGNDNEQTDIAAIESGEHYLPAGERKIAPSAHIKTYYALTGKVHLPAHLYYEKNLLAIITN